MAIIHPVFHLSVFFRLCVILYGPCFTIRTFVRKQLDTGAFAFSRFAFMVFHDIDKN